MLSVRQVATQLDVSESLVYGWVESGELPHYRLGAKGKRGKIVVDPADLAAFLAARKHEGWREEPKPPPPPASRSSRPSAFRHLRVR